MNEKIKIVKSDLITQVDMRQRDRIIEPTNAELLIETIPKRLSYYLSEINVLHPFREVNGRTQRAFIELLAKERGFMVDFSKIDPKDMIVASAESFYCNYDKMDAIFQKITSPFPPEVLQQMDKNLSSKP